ncbi:hypothetical protein JCM10450v2_004678 [Rhodotorula kratochvilovae]
MYIQSKKRVCEVTEYDWHINEPMFALARRDRLSLQNAVADLNSSAMLRVTSYPYDYEVVTASLEWSTKPDGVMYHVEVFWVDATGKNTLLPHDDEAAAENNPGSQVFATEAASQGRFVAETLASYLVRLSIVHLSRPDDSNIKVDKSDAAVKNSLKAFCTFSSSPLPNDARLVFKKDREVVRELWSDSALLSSVSPFFADLFQSGFRESEKLTLSQRESCTASDGHAAERTDQQDLEDSDDEADKFARTPASTVPPADFAFFEFDFSSLAYTTVQAFLAWACTGHVSFCPVTSSYAADDGTTAATGKRAYLVSRLADDPSLPLPASPKSLYRLADFLDVPSLRALALSNLTAQLCPRVVTAEIFSPFAAAFPEAYANRDWRAFKTSEAWTREMERVRSGERVVPGPVVADLLTA